MPCAQSRGSAGHPTQALLDALTIRRRKGQLGGLTVAIWGDILQSRVARSNIALLNTMGRGCGSTAAAIRSNRTASWNNS
jgi:aspartate carbamoyltransferase catalytic subunit